MKVSVHHIVLAHVNTLKNDETRLLSLTDILIFFGIPIFASVATKLFCTELQREVYSVSINIFGIFVALLLNVQVAIFGIFQRGRDLPDDPRLAEMQQEELNLRQKLLGELNTNVSYLVLVSCFALVAFLCAYTFEFNSGFGPAISVVIYSHFMLTLLMILKRAHALFQREYES